jgi:chromosomal replication initiator protein
MKDLNKISTIVKAVSALTKVSVSDILSQSREGRIVKARHIAMWVSRWYTEASLQTIASALNCKRHATVIHGATQIDNAISINKTFAAEIQQFAKQFKS